MIEQIFDVATEFKFEVGQAILNTNALTGAVDDLNKSTQTAVGSLNFLASGLVAHLGLGSGGLLSILTQSIKLSEEFQTASLGFVNSFGSNMKYLTGDITTFNDKLGTSGTILEAIQGMSAQYALPSTQLAEMTQKLAPPLAARGMLGKNYSGGIDMAKNIMLSSEQMQINPQVLSDSILGAMSGQGLHGKAFARLVNTPTFHESGIKTQQGLMAMQPIKKIEILSKALKDLAMDSDSLTYRMNSIDKQIVSLRENLAPLFRVIGDSIIKPIVLILKQVNAYVAQNGKKIGDAIAGFIGNVFKDPKKLFVNLYQLMNLKNDMKSAFDLTGLFQTFLFIKWGLKMLGIELKGLGYWLGRLMEVFGLLPNLTGFLSLFWRVIKFVGSAIMEVVPIFAAFLFVLQVISRAKGIAKLHDLTGFFDALPGMGDTMVKLKNAISTIISPITMAVDGWANLIAPLFETTFWVSKMIPWLDKFVWFLEKIGWLITHMMAVVAGGTNTLLAGLFNSGGKPMGLSGIADAFKEGYSDYLNQSKSGGDPTKVTQGNVMNVGNYNVTMQFKEQLEPDRIAFALKDQLYKAMKNQTQAKGNSMQGAFATATFAGGR